MTHPIPMPIGRRALAGGLVALAAGPARAETRKRYSFDQKSGTLEFTARHLGILTSTGKFDDFMAELLIDPDRPLTSHVSATVRTAAIDIAYPGAVDLLRSPDFFDVETYPEARFTGAATGQGSLERFTLAGDLTIRGITRPFRMEARLLGRQRDATLGGDVANFSAEGDMKRSEYGMVSDAASISDTIRLSVRVRILLT
ncbi:YceI family protein [Roseomonas sp. HJA6]|uniref:YceI family protein n=1 Tax=Roseomonas alba TaxID=2846776 RepID=A0ABS7AE77_9PROT|nr:YceI family protein [Neoroseomonas alba]MBW6399469.1 YceI family protein [Neoroseomonas alba]